MEDTTVQLTWRGLEGAARLAVGGASAEVSAPFGAVVLDGLPAATTLDVVAEVEGRRARRVARARTLAPPPGRELARVATVSDCHLGGSGFGALPAVRPPDDRVHDLCLAAALREAAGWGAQLVVAKGDLTEGGRPEEWARVASVVAASPVPVEAVAGNHDRRRGSASGVEALAAAGARLTERGATGRDLPGVRVVLADSTNPGHHHGRYDLVRDRVAELVAEAPAALVAVHHQPQRFGRTTHWPPGVPRPDAAAFLDAVAAANPATLVTTGHTHRHRRRHHGPVVVAEVGSTKDHPGTWAGYVVHEGGIRSVVRRVADPAAMAWTEATRRCFLGTWGPWSTWTLAARCFSHPWPTR